MNIHLHSTVYTKPEPFINGSARNLFRMASLYSVQYGISLYQFLCKHDDEWLLVEVKFPEFANSVISAVSQKMSSLQVGYMKF